MIRKITVFGLVGMLLLLSSAHAQSSSSASTSSSPSPLVAKIAQLQISPPYPSPFDFYLASYVPTNFTWYVPVGNNDVLQVDWVHTNCSSISNSVAVPVFTYDGDAWNDACDEGYDARAVQSAFEQYYAAHFISTPTISYMYYPHIVASVGGDSSSPSNWTKLILAESATVNRTLAIVPTCAYHFMGGLNNVLVSAINDPNDDLYTYYYWPITPSDSIFLSAITNPFAGESCFYDGELCWIVVCETSQSLNPKNAAGSTPRKA